jgi:Tfp pilus assembly protein FimT
MQGRRGATLLEVIAALGLGGIVAGVVSARLTTLAASLELATSARSIAQTLRMVRAQALAEGTPLDATFDATAGTWCIEGPGGATRTTALPFPVAFTSLPARARIRFGSTGTAENGTIVLAADGRDASIIVNQRGRVRLQ